MEAVVEQSGSDVSEIIANFLVRTDSVLRRLFGCWHREMSRPFSRRGEAYRTCVACGARRRFDLEQWEMVGSFYHPARNLNLYARTR